MINCLIIDDEPLALDLLEDFISRVPFLKLVEKCSCAFEAMKVMEHENIELLFLDIQMPDITGIQFLKALENKPKVIFTTAYPEHAIEGFELDATDYLLKPFSFERFNKAVNKASEQIQSVVSAHQAQHDSSDEKDYIFIKSGYDTVKVQFKNIRYIQGLKDYVKIYTHEGTVLSLVSMKAILNRLPADNFVRVHRSYIVAIDKIDLIQRRKISLGEKEIPVGDTFRKEFLEAIDKE